MKLHYKLAVIAACLAAGRLLFYLLLGNSATEPPPRRDQGPALKVVQHVRGRLVTRQPTAFRLLHRPILNRQPRPLTKRRKKPASDRIPNEPVFRLHTWQGEQWMHLAVVACGDRLEETMTMLKSVLLFTLNKIKFHIFAEDALQPQFETSIKAWPFSFRSQVDYNIYPITFLAGKPQEWKKLFKPCAAQRLFLPNSMIPTGLRWEELLYPLYHKYKNDITWGDQDLLNIIFHYNPEYLYVFPCQWNYRPDHCMYGSNCRGAEDQGVSILHGNRGVYHDDKQPAFKVMYEAIRDFPFEENLFQSLFFPLQNNFLKTVHTLCGRLPQVFLKQVEQAMRKVYELRVIHVG
ncbi:glucoside xylosyltransferase 2 isoform X2 [Hemiscyllium ocellatum]|uniref:glucoside xylosyltransferase 2 isoform X2 n=1 Tax=Hemiscyllium ocellatum TaxID=170820 RepID=UPI002965E05D|nr:glucoside xylosyltransferase 2 isoform X2 [Hemiscyllium ocellatum]